MNRLLALLLALAMCLSLCACGGKEEPAAQPETTISNEPPAATITDHPLLPNMYGEWLLTDISNPENYLFSSAIIHEDGTAVVDGEELVWRIDENNTEDAKLALYFYRGTEKVVGAVYGEEGWFACFRADGVIFPQPYSAYVNRAAATPEQLRLADPDTYVVPMICGTWLLTQDAEGMPLEIRLNEDYTCNVDGVSYIWTLKLRSGDWFDVVILDGSSVVYETQIEYGGEWLLQIDNGQDTSKYINPAHYDIIEITPENWLDYFEIVPYMGWERDAFDEVIRLNMYAHTIRLKQEYVSRLSYAVTGNQFSTMRLTKNAIEISFSYAQQKCDVDLENRTVIPREGEYTFKERFTESYKLFYRYYKTGDQYEQDLAGGGVITYSWGTDGTTIPYVYDFELLRAECPLYLLKDEYCRSAE